MSKEKDTIFNIAGQVKDETLNAFVRETLINLPEYFWEVAASSTGKYHPSYVLGTGGLARHTIAAAKIAIMLFDMHPTLFTPVERDCIVIALLLHDGLKHGLVKSKYTAVDHPVIMATWLETLTGFQVLPEAQKILIHDGILTHMGRWNFDYREKKILMPLPETTTQRFIHMCDYLASRKCLEFNFEVN